jgi:heme-degrading monooxygenase HmoA
MIVRSWRGYAATDRPGRYPAHLLGTVKPRLEGIAGFRGLYLLKRETPAEIEYHVLTLWDSMAAIRSFAGETPDRAVVEPEAAALLRRFDEDVVHYEVMHSPFA